MNTELLQGMIDVVFKGNLVYLSPFLFLLMVILFSDRLIEFIYNSIDGNGNTRRRNKY
ncbi:hypothetical protein [Peribacillus sp. TH24]|uniref:hypothetical protein n=1 Tax=Peribacillus sp. TH24 TaxID=2798483 RepID=UPI0019137F9C|nr:hypothetical protein [Peribacillus sp. TH24]MBK5447028.1 hypothetical protein [Peribacillus sp. TH24]MBK5447059.1 hypothetical protein [Peribacillus sp. TH24]